MSDIKTPLDLGKHIVQDFYGMKGANDDYAQWVATEVDKMNNTDFKIKRLLELSDEFVFPDFYPHTNKVMWKISNPYTKYSAQTFVLCGLDEGIDKALDLAIDHIAKAKKEFYS